MACNAPFILSPFSLLNLIILTSILVISVSHSWYWYCLALVLTVSTTSHTYIYIALDLSLSVGIHYITGLELRIITRLSGYVIVIEKIYTKSKSNFL